jgi:hypothetical protein
MFTGFAKVPGMSEDQQEPGELTERFRAFSQSVDPAPSKALPVALIATIGAVALLLIVVVWILLAS